MGVWVLICNIVGWWVHRLRWSYSTVMHNTIRTRRCYVQKVGSEHSCQPPYPTVPAIRKKTFPVLVRFYEFAVNIWLTAPATDIYYARFYRFETTHVLCTAAASRWPVLAICTTCHTKMLFLGVSTAITKFFNQILPVSYTHLTLPTNREV